MSNKIVEIRPNPNFSKTATGSYMLTGEFRNSKGEVILNLVGRDRALVIPPQGMMLLPNDFPLHADIIKAAKESEDFKNILGYTDNLETLNQNQRFYLHDQEKADNDEHNTILEQHAVVNQILNMDDRVVNFAKLFGITSKDEKVCKNKLIVFAKDKEMRKKIAEHFENPDRMILEVIYASLEKGNANEKKGLYSENGYYFYMGNSIGYGIQKVVEWIKDEKDIYAHLRSETHGKESGKSTKKST